MRSLCIAGLVLVASCVEEGTNNVAVGIPTRISVTGPAGAVLVRPEVSPDGETIAFAAFVARGHGLVYVGSFSNVEAVPLQGGDYSWPSGGFSPDGKFLLVTDFQPPKMLKRVPITGGQAMPIAVAGNHAATWGPNDNIVMGSNEGLWLVAASGGERTALTTLAEGEQGHWLPRFLPHGRAVLFFILTGDRDTGQVGLFDFENGERRTLLSGTASAFAPSGHLVFWRDGALWAVRFDPDLLEISGTPVVVVRDVGADYMGDAWFSVSVEGTLAYIPTPKDSVTTDTVPEVILVKNWSEELKRLVATP